jgi:hypothetical protein
MVMMMMHTTIDFLLMVMMMMHTIIDFLLMVMMMMGWGICKGTSVPTPKIKYDILVSKCLETSK